jgi:hypothetical protein
VQALVRTTVAALLVLSLGLHWGLLQTVAWTGMLINNSRAGPFKEAVSKTFDGEHPCCLCKAIKQGRAEERKQRQQKPENGLKIEFPLPAESMVLIAPEVAEDLIRSNVLRASFFVEPPTPPPRRPVAA